MLTIARCWSCLAVAGLALGTLLSSGCASLGKSPPAVAPTSFSEASSQRRPAPAVAKEGELDPRGAMANKPEREKVAA